MILVLIGCIFESLLFLNLLLELMHHTNKHVLLLGKDLKYCSLLPYCFRSIPFKCKLLFHLQQCFLCCNTKGKQMSSHILLALQSHIFLSAIFLKQNFSFVFQVPMNEYSSRIQSFMSEDKVEICPTNDENRF